MTADDTETQRVEAEGRYGSDDWFAVHDDIFGKRTPSAFIGGGHDERVICEGLTHEDADQIVRAVNAHAARAAGDDLAVERAWDEGYEAGHSDGHAGRWDDNCTRNPHRTARTIPTEETK